MVEYLPQRLGITLQLANRPRLPSILFEETKSLIKIEDLHASVRTRHCSHSLVKFDISPLPLLALIPNIVIFSS